MLAKASLFEKVSKDIRLIRLAKELQWRLESAWTPQSWTEVNVGGIYWLNHKPSVLWHSLATLLCSTFLHLEDLLQESMNGVLQLKPTESQCHIWQCCGCKKNEPLLIICWELCTCSVWPYDKRTLIFNAYFLNYLEPSLRTPASAASLQHDSSKYCVCHWTCQRMHLVRLYYRASFPN